MFKFLKQSNLEIAKLAATYHLSSTGTQYDAGCPGTMNPLGETPPIDLAWSGSSIHDKAERLNQFSKALKVLDHYSNNGENIIKEEYLGLNVHGRVMFSNIVSKQLPHTAEKIFKAISSYAHDGLNLPEIPNGKGNTSVKEIFNHYITPTIQHYEPSFSLDDSHMKVAGDLSNSDFSPQATALDINNNSFPHTTTTTTSSSSQATKIELREYEINVLFIKASHQFLVRYDSEGKIVGELHGLATDPDTGQSKEISFGPPDLLKAWEYPLSGQPLAIPANDGGYSGLYLNNQSAKTLLAGSEGQIKERWDAAHQAVEILKSREIQYNPLGGTANDLNSGNSNSMARTLGDVMGFSHDNISGRIAIGQEKNLLPQATYPDLYHDHWNNDGIHLTGDSNVIDLT